MEKNWNGLPYFTIGDFYRQKFGGKVFKIPVSVVDDCPNRMGLKGMKTCVFCDEWGSAANSDSFSMGLEQQIQVYQQKIGKKYNSQNFLVYFQAYTNTFQKLSVLRENFETALRFPFVQGLVIGTRPDCLSKAVLDMWNEVSQKTYLSVEMGVQSFFDQDLEFMQRGHTRAQALQGLLRVAKEAPNVDLGIHLIFGWPQETTQQIIESAEIVNSLPVRHVKLHHLHVLKKTELEKIYADGHCPVMTREEYAEKVRIFLQHLSPKIYVQRLAAYSSRWDELIAPDWTADKMGTHQAIIDHLRHHKSYQSQNYFCTNQDEQMKQEQLAFQSKPHLKS
jgi:radical SAM protein (TIGR01212 family)